MMVLFKVLIMRGIPGSGKTHWLAECASRHVGHPITNLVSADFYHMQNNVYQFDPALARTAHNWALHNFLATLAHPFYGGRQVVAVDNTNTTLWELAPYYRAAEAMDYDVEIVELSTPLELCLVRQSHAVPPNTLRQMAERLAEHTLLLPPWWKRTIVRGDADGTA